MFTFASSHQHFVALTAPPHLQSTATAPMSSIAIGHVRSPTRASVRRRVALFIVAPGPVERLDIIHFSPLVTSVAPHNGTRAATALRADVVIRPGAAHRAIDRCEETKRNCGLTRSRLYAEGAGRSTGAMKAAVDGQFLLQA